jgi:hypothetical protein
LFLHRKNPPELIPLTSHFVAGNPPIYYKVPFRHIYTRLNPYIASHRRNLKPSQQPSSHARTYTHTRTITRTPTRTRAYRAHAPPRTPSRTRTHTRARWSSKKLQKVTPKVTPKSLVTIRVTGCNRCNQKIYTPPPSHVHAYTHARTHARTRTRTHVSISIFF